MTTITASSPTKRRSLLAIVAIVVLALAAAGCMPKDSRTFLDRTNSLRKSVGVHSLAENDTLTKKAEAWAQHMASTGKLEHSDLAAGLGDTGYLALELIQPNGELITSDFAPEMLTAAQRRAPDHGNIRFRQIDLSTPIDQPTATVDGVSLVEEPEAGHRLIGYVPDSLPSHRDITVH